MSIFDEVTGRYRAPRLDDLPPPPEPSIWRSAQQGLSDFMDSPWGAAAEIPLTVVTAPQRAVESVIGAFRGGFKLSDAEREAYGREAYDRDAAVPKFGGGESAFDTVARRLRGRAYTAPTGGQIARETVAGAGELVGAPSTATVMGLSRDPSEAGGYRPIAESEQARFERERPVLSRVAAPLRVGTEFAGSLATDPTSLLAFGPKLAAKAGGTIAKEAAEAALRSAALETAKAERLASRLFVPGAVTGAVGGTLEAGRAISEEGAFSPGAIEASLGAGLSVGMGALAGRNAVRGLDSLPPPPKPELRWYGFDEPQARSVEVPQVEPARSARPKLTPEQPVNLADLPQPPEPLRPFDTPSEPDRYAYRARTVGEQGIPATGHAQASLSEQDVRRMAPSRTDEPQEVARVDLKGLGPSKFEIRETPSGEKWVRFKENLPEDAVETLGPIDAIDRAAADKATPPVRAAVESADVADLAQATGLSLERAAKGADDVRADGVRELSPEAVAIKKTVLQADPSMLEPEAKPVDLRSDPTEPLPPAEGQPVRPKAQRQPPLPTPPRDPAGNPILPGQETWTPEERAVVHSTAKAIVGDVVAGQKLQPTGRAPILGGVARNSVEGYIGTNSPKSGTPLETLPYTPSQMRAAIERDKGNPIELDIHEAIRGDERVVERLADAGDAGGGDASFDFGANAKYSVRPVPGQRGLEGIGRDVERAGERPTSPEQSSMFGGEMLQGVEVRTTEGREADGGLFNQDRVARERSAAAAQTTLGAGGLKVPSSALRDNYLKPLSTYADSLHRESSIDDAYELLLDRIDRPKETFLASSPDMALGQGANRGIKLTFDSADLQGQINRAKPTWQPTWDSGAAEFIGKHNKSSQYMNALREVTIAKDAQGYKPYIIQIKRALEGWEQTKNPDGSTTYRRPEATASATPERKLSVSRRRLERDGLENVSRQDEFSGLRVMDGPIKNQDSIDATFNEDEYEVLPGLKRLPLDAFDSAPEQNFYSKSDRDRVSSLAEQIRQSGEISPLIAVLDDDGQYILEGGHRLGALHELGAKDFPALVVDARTRKLSAEPMAPQGQAVNVDNVRRAFPTGKITENEGAWDVRLPGNRNIRITPTGDVEFSLGDLTRGHPEAVEGGGLKPGQRVVGSWQRIGRGGLISLAKEAGQGTLDHETFHAAMELVLSDRERKAVMKRFGNEERAADAYGAWTPADKSNAVFAKLAQFFQRLYRNLFPNAESVFGKIRTGEAFNREGAPYPDVPLPARAPEPTVRESRTVEPVPTNYREFLDSNMDEAPAPEPPPVTGRRVLPGETPRVEHRVDDIAAATADAGIPEEPLKRDTPQSWESLDPKVQEVLRTYDDQKFYDIMSRRNLDAVETQAFDAVIKGKSERLEKLKQQQRTPETDALIAADTLDYIAAQRAYVNDGTGLARALAARARVMSAARPVEAFSRRLEAFRVTPQMAGEVLTAIRKDPTLLDLIRSEARALRLSVVEGAEGTVKLSAQAVAKLSDRLKGLGLSDEQSNAFVKALREDSGFLPELEAAVKNAAAEPTDVLLKKVFREIKGVSDEQAAEILTAFKENPDSLGPLLQSALGAGKIRKALEWWRAGLLSSFSTDAANVSGNIAEHHIRLAETGVASALDWMLQKVYGGDRARFAGEVGAEMAGANMAFGPALKNLARNLKDVATLKDKPLDLSRKLEGQFGAIGGTTGKVVRAIGFGRMGAEDVFFKEWGGGAEAMKLAYRKAANSLPAGTSKAEIRTRAKQIIDEMADPENTSHSDIAAEVEKAKDYRTFQERRVGSLTDALSGVVRRNPMLSFVAPFVNTPGNIANAIIRRSPLGARQAMKVFGEFKKAQADFAAGKIDQAAFSAARGKLADAITAPLMGTAMLAGFTLYANAGGMTGSGPTDDRAKNALKESGWSPYSFVFTDPTSGKKVYIPFNRFEPVSSMLGFAADMAEAKNVRNLSLFDKALGSVVENLTSKSYLTGLSEAASLITKPKEFAPQYIKGFVGSWVPNIVGRTASAVDPIQRDTRASKSGFAGLPEAIGKNIQSRIPFASQALPARMSSTGAPVERPGNALTRFASPVQPTVEKPERFLEREYGRLGWAPTSPSRGVTVKGIKTNLTDDEFNVMTKASRRASDEARNLIRSAHYKSLPDDQRELLLDRIYSKWKARGRQSIRAKLERRVAREARA